ncbi:MAG: SAM-dependent methyltransferase [Bacillota bacterium]
MESYARFMDRALYHPEYGYYMQARDPIGRQGDFYTAPRCHSWFGALLGQELARQWRAWGQPGDFYFLEWGCGDGQLAVDLLDWLRAEAADCYASLQAVLIDISPWQQQRAKAKIEQAGHTDRTVISTTGPADPLAFAVIVAYEFLDALPVHQLRWTGRKWQEAFWREDGRLVWAQPSRAELLDELKNWDFTPRPGQKVEVGLAGKQWLQHLARLVRCGRLLVIDYGYEEAELVYWPQGTLRSYCGHQVKEVEWRAAGQEDITAGVNFSALCRWGNELGWQCSQRQPLGQWLLAKGLATWLLEKRPDLEERLRLKHFFCPGGIGEKFSLVEASWPLG